MLRPKYRNIIPNESEEKKNKDKSTYSEIYEIGGLDSKAKLIIKSLHTEKSNFEIHGNFLYQINNCSHFEIDSELDFSKSSNYRTQEKNAFEPNKTLFRSHIEPFQDLYKATIKEKAKKDEEEDGICKVQYNRGYKIKANIKLAFTFPSLEKQLSFVKEDHKEINEYMEQWRKFKPSQIEQLLLFYDSNNLNDSFNDNDIKKSGMISKSNNINAYSKFDISKKRYIDNNIYKKNKPSCEILREFAENNNLSILSNREQNDNNRNNNLNIENNINQASDKNICFIDESFPPCQEEYRVIDLNKVITTTKRFSSTEKSEDKKRKIVFHYRPLETLIPDTKQIFNIDEVNCYDIKCGLFKNKNIISVFAHLADYPFLLSKIFVENKINTFGIYKVKLFYQNIWTDIYIDKYIPCFPCHFPLYTYSDSSLWPCVLEKALAKLFRGYEKLKYISFFELYQILTGFPIINFKKNYKNIEKDKLREIFENFNNKDTTNLEELSDVFKFSVNSKYSNKGVEIINKEDVINSYLFHDINSYNYYGGDDNKINNFFKSFKKENKKNNFYNLDDDDDEDNNNSPNKITYINEVYYNNPYLLAFYASESYLKYLLKIEFFPIGKKNLMTISNKIFPVKFANEKFVVIKSIYNQQLKKLLFNYFTDDVISTNNQYDLNSNKTQNTSKETETLTLPWDILFTLFDNVILIKVNDYDELHFRNGFVRCQDVKSPDYDRILAHSYYELKIEKYKAEKEIVRFKEDINDKKSEKENEELEKNKNDKKENIKKEKKRIFSTNVKLDTLKYFDNKDNLKKNNLANKDKKDLIPVTIVINLSNDHFFDSSYYSREMDLKLGILQLVKKNQQNKKDANMAKRKNILDPFNGYNPVLITSPDFQIGYSLVYDFFLEKGSYIIVPMTMGYCMQKNEKIKSFYYSLRDKNGLPLPIHKTVIPRFLEDVFYLNDPFGYNYLEYKVINEIAKNILDNKGHKIKKIDENSLFNKYSKIGEGDYKMIKEEFGLSKLSFEDFIFEEMTLLTESQKKQCMQNLGYENNTYPYLSRFIGVSFYFGKFINKSSPRDSIKITPRNNLVDSYMDKFVNIRNLEKNFYQMKDMESSTPKRLYYTSPGWYTIEGVYMKKNLMGKEEKKIFNFKKELYNGKKVFFSTNSNNITTMAISGRIKFLLYVVNDVFKIKGKNNKSNSNDSNNSSEEVKRDNDENNIEEEDKSKESEKSSSEENNNEK